MGKPFGEAPKHQQNIDASHVETTHQKEKLRQTWNKMIGFVYVKRSCQSTLVQGRKKPWQVQKTKESKF